MTRLWNDTPIDIHPITDACFSAERPGLINASEVACLFGVGRVTLAKLTADKRDPAPAQVEEPDPSLDPDGEDSSLLERGNDLQEPATRRVEKLRPTWRIMRNTNHYVDRINRMAAIPDNLVEAPERKGIGCLEIKVVTNAVFRKKWPDSPPLGHLLQLTQQMMLVPGCTWGAIGALIIGEFKYETRVYEIERNPQAEIRLRTAVAEFWKKFDAGDLPAVDFERDGALIELMYPTETPGKIVDLNSDNLIQELLERHEILKATAKDVETRLKTTDNEIKAKLADAEAGLVRGWRLTFKEQHRKEHMVKATSFRVLRIDRDEQEKRPA